MQKTEDLEFVRKMKRTLESGRNVVIAHFNVEDEFAVGDGAQSVKQILVESIGTKGYISYDLTGISFDSYETKVMFLAASKIFEIPECPGEPPVVDMENNPDSLTEAAEWQEKAAVWRMWEYAVAKAEQKETHPIDIALSMLDIPIDPALPIPLDIALPILNRLVTSDKVKYTDVEGKKLEVDTKNYCLLFDYAHTVVPAADISSTNTEQKKLDIYLTKWSEFGQTPPVILLARNLTDIDETIYGRGSSVTTVRVNYPDYEYRYEYLKYLKHGFAFKLNGSTLEEIARISAGLSNRHLKALVQECLSEGKQVTKDIVLEYKQNVISDELAGMIEFVNPLHGFECVGGLEHVKTELGEVAEAILSGRDWLVPMGVLLVGPPGTGKTVVAESLAKAINFTFIKFGNVKSKWVGESERNIAKVFEMAKALAPVVIFIDEIDQEGQRGNEGDSGVSNHIFASILRTMSDTDLRGKIIWIAATNRPDMMDAAMKRPGRFDIRIPLLYPDKVERAQIFQVMFTKYDLIPGRDINYSALAEMTDEHNGADIEAIVLNAAKFSYREEQTKTITMRYLLMAIEDYLTHHDKDAIEKQTKMALKEASSIRLLPEAYREAVLEQKRGQMEKAEAPKVRVKGSE
jgi:transitional endoplasmic reticulum ATPase